MHTDRTGRRMGPPGLGPGRRPSPHQRSGKAPRTDPQGPVRAWTRSGGFRGGWWGGGWDRRGPAGSCLASIPSPSQSRIPSWPARGLQPLHGPSPAEPRIQGSSYKHSASEKRGRAVAVPGEPQGAPGHPGSCPDRAHPRCDPDQQGAGSVDGKMSLKCLPARLS